MGTTYAQYTPQEYKNAVDTVLQVANKDKTALNGALSKLRSIF